METFAAVRFYIDNWCWQGVPFILWSGKRMKSKVSEVMIRFRKQKPHPTVFITMWVVVVGVE